MTTELRVGMIVPPAGDHVPPEAYELFPAGVSFFAKSVSIPSVTAEGFDEALERLTDAVAALVEQQPDAVSMMGTSISFYHGWDGHQKLLDRLSEAAKGIPVTTMADAIIKGLRNADAKRVAVGCAYHADLERRLHDFLGEAGIEVVAARRMDLTNVGDVLSVGTEELVAFGDELRQSATDADALLISCGGLRTLEATKILEERYGLPVISSAVAGVEDAVSVAR